jgi:hypothetical protein
MKSVLSDKTCLCLQLLAGKIQKNFFNYVCA